MKAHQLRLQDSRLLIVEVVTSHQERALWYVPRILTQSSEKCYFDQQMLYREKPLAVFK